MEAVDPKPDLAKPASTGAAAGASERFRALDAWRGICALLVAAFHFPSPGAIHTSQVVQHAYRFVDFFFVLSGFVIAHAYRRSLENGELLPFMVRRIGRLWPLHAATLAALIVIAVAGA